MSEAFKYSSPPPSRNGLERSLHYGPVGLRRYQTFIVNTYTLIAAVGALLFTAAIIFGSTKLAAVGLLVFLFFGPPLIFGWILLRQMTIRRIDVNDAGLIIDNGKTREDFAFSDVEALKFRWIPGLTFHVRFLMKDGRKLVLPSVVERLDYPLDLFAGARPDLASDPSFRYHRSVAICLDHSWARFGQTMASPLRGVGTIAGRFLFSVVCAAGVTSIGQQMGFFPRIEHFASFMLWFWDVLFMSMLVWTLSYAAFEMHFYYQGMKRLKDDPYAVKRDLRYESDFRKKAVRWTYSGALLMAVAIAGVASADIRENEQRLASQDKTESAQTSERVPANFEQRGER